MAAEVAAGDLVHGEGKTAVGIEYLRRAVLLPQLCQEPGAEGVPIEGRRLIRLVADGHGQLCRELLLQRLLGVEVQRQSAGDHHQHHGGENADVGQSHGVAPHPVEHTGNADKVPGLIVVAFILPQRLQRHDADSREQGVGSNDHKDHRREVEREGHAGVIGKDGDGVAPAESQNAQDGHGPVALGLPFSGAGRAHQLHGALPPHPDEVHEKVPQKDQREKRYGGENSLPRDVEGKACAMEGHDAAKEKRHQLLQQQSRQDPAADADEGGVDCLHSQHPGDVPLSHPQNVIKSQRLPPPLHEEAVGIAEKDHRENGDDEKAERHEHGEVDIAVHDRQIPGSRQGPDDVEGRSGTPQRQKIGYIELPVADDVAPGQLRVESGLTHGSHRLGRAPSGCRKCGGTGLPGSPLPGRAGGRPGRPAGRAPARHGWPPSRSGSPSRWSGPGR